ncbi:MaoC family dehydratase N-terminal domain-containing protein [Chloroflexota bacterium]
MASKILYWEDVVEGSEIPSVALEITRHRIVMIVSATRDIFPLHHDPDFARAAGYRAPAVATAFLQGFLGRCLTDWTGPTGKIRKLGLKLRAPAVAGDSISAGGKVTRKYMENGDHKVDCELSVVKQDGITAVDAEATVIVPSRN